jgi:short-subunit dehydrogenase
MRPVLITTDKQAMICTFRVLPSMRQCREGCIINIASRAGTVSMPFACAYSTGKAGLIKATACVQAELEIDGFGDAIHVYALHPGAVKT